MSTYRIYADPGHAWCRVHRSKLIKLGILDKISSYSYQRGEWVYLEEDNDLSKFIAACKEKGETPKFIEEHTNRQSKIRSYEYFKFIKETTP